MFQHHLIERGIVTVGNHFPGFGLIERSAFLDQAQESATAIFEMGCPMLNFCRAKWMDIESDAFSFLTVTITLEGPNLVERYPQIGAAKRFVLIEFQSVLIIQVKRP